MAISKLNVSIATLSKEAEIISTQIKEIEKNWNLLSNIIDKMKTYWEGEASNKNTKLFSVEKTDMEKVIKKLKEHPTDLYAMAGVYEDAEKKAKNLSNALPSDVIV